MKLRPFAVIGVMVLMFSNMAKADEGMWMINAIDAALEKKMQERGLELSANEIYNADAPGASVADAVVSLDFGCTGSMISDQGLLITNHHCAYGDVHALSTPEHNYLEDGFWAFRSDEEIHIKGKSVYFLKKVLDVTEEVLRMQEEMALEGKPMGMRKLSFVMEKKYKEETGMETWLASMWKGKKYYMALYEVYTDIRLVAAPPVSAAAFGGDIDNWEWPQHKCDFALYRIYTAPDGSPAEYSEQNIPMKPERKLTISLDGYQDGDYTMIIGYPGRTNRYSSSFEVDFETSVELPVSNRIRTAQMEIIKEWMDRDPDIRLKYADYFFTLSNMQENFCGLEDCVKRFGVVGKKAAIEQDMQKWNSTLEGLKTKYKAITDIERNTLYYRETMIRGSRLNQIMMRAHNQRNKDATGEKMLAKYAELDLRVEKDLTLYAIREYVANMDAEFMGPWQKEMIAKFNGDSQALAEYLWDNSIFTSEEGIARLGKREVPYEDIAADPLCRFTQEVRAANLNRIKTETEGTPDILDLKKEYTHALYDLKAEMGEPQYPDANSTMRITYGAVGGFEPYDGVLCDWKTTPAGILEKYSPADYDFTLNDRQYLLYRKGDWGRWGFGPDGNMMYVNFLTDNDITGGNSGSPVLNSRGELIGLAFDGNKESLASDVWYTPGYNMCVCVDIRFILWTLDRYAGMTRIIDEIGL
ncbi:MAG: S46 family peptidase [Bacteroidales bacterium]|nr:S46 family peptidase [Bacteroidales bacterium]